MSARLFPASATSTGTCQTPMAARATKSELSALLAALECGDDIPHPGLEHAAAEALEQLGVLAALDDHGPGQLDRKPPAGELEVGDEILPCAAGVDRRVTRLLVGEYRRDQV